MQMQFQTWIDSQNIRNVGSCESQGRIDYAPEATNEDRVRGEALMHQWQAMTDAERETAGEQARLQAVYADHAANIQEFATAWAKTGIESVPDDWQEAITLLKAKYASLVTIEEKLEHMSVQQELITLRFGPLADVWDDVTVILNTPQ